jgi:hypothetical protein
LGDDFIDMGTLIPWLELHKDAAGVGRGAVRAGADGGKIGFYVRILANGTAYRL